MKKILFIAPDYYGFCNVVFDGLKRYSGCDVQYLDSASGYKYKNLGERVYNFFLKNLFKKNIKIIRREKYISDLISRMDYDILIVIGAYVLSSENLGLAIGKAKCSISIFWDSISKIPMQEEYIDKFDICYSFDKEDCCKYHLKFNPNFYFVEDSNIINEFDVSYLATYDDRMDGAIRIFEYFEKNNIRAKAKVFTYSPNKIVGELPNNMEVIHKIIPFAESYQYYQDSKVILDIAHSNQRGLSFRPFEAMGMRKKLITTNIDIVNYDFYNPNNIFVIQDINNIDIPSSFFETDYQEIPIEIKGKYHLKNWVENILSYHSI